MPNAHVVAPFAPRFGQWVSFTPPIAVPGAHLAPNGQTVGLYTGPQDPSPVSLAVAGRLAESPPEAATRLPARIEPVDADGARIERPKLQGQPQGDWWFTREQVSDLRPVEKREHIPAARLTGNPDWHPRA